MLTFAFSLCLTRLVEPTQRRRWLVALAAVVILAGAFATQRKSALVVPVAVVAAMVVIRPREAVRLAPIGVVMLLAMPIVAPGALGSIRNQLFTSQVAQSNSTTGRTRGLRGRPARPRGPPDVRARLRLLRPAQVPDHRQPVHRPGDRDRLRRRRRLPAAAARRRRSRRGRRCARATRAGRRPRSRPRARPSRSASPRRCSTCFAYPQVPYVFLFVAGLAVVCSAGAMPGATESNPAT